MTGSHVLRLVYDDGETCDVDFRPVLDKGGVFPVFTDPEVFSQVCLSDDRRYITWPGDLDFCADALRAGDRVTATT